MTTISQLSTTTLSQKQNHKWTKQTTRQEQIHRNGDPMEGYQQGRRGGRMEEKVQGIRHINGR